MALLSDNRDNVNAVNMHAQSPIRSEATGEHINVVEYLLAVGADVDFSDASQVISLLYFPMVDIKDVLLTQMRHV